VKIVDSMNLEFSRAIHIRNFRSLLPAMHGVWSIWLVATLLGVVKSEATSLAGILISVIVLFSIQPLQDLIQKGEVMLKLIFPGILGLLISGMVVVYAGFLYILIPYVLLFLFHIVLRKNFEGYLVTGSLLMTLPFPLITFLSGKGFPDILPVWVSLFLVVFHSTLIAESVIDRKRTGKKRALPLISFSILFPIAFLILPLSVALFVLLLSIGVSVLTRNVSVKTLGRSLLLYQLVFVCLMVFV